MRSLSNQQKQLLFDYCIGLTSPEETAQAEALISSNEEAAELYTKLKSNISPLESIKPQTCPDNLAERTIWRLNNLANSSQNRLEQLIAAETTRKVASQSGFWGKRMAVAAVFLIVGAVCIGSYNSIVTGYARQKSERQQCQMQLRQIWQALNNYSSDYDGNLPTLAAAAGEPWWKVGYQGKENHSNTRPIWLLAKNNYIKPADFICPGSSKGKTLQLDASQVQNLSDFPGREYMTYSFKISCSSSASGKLVCRKVLMADLSPLFEELPRDYSGSFRLHLTKDLLTRNSINHKRRGQNVLFGDGRVEFIKTRFTNLLEDDIFTLRDTDIYQGCELPSCENDFFLAP
ncbi:MAG: hypothetical protein A2173_06690 [Planctomycetes bacterium RBG_13_44_8b]|nr:MAG: hypothetical protein A2173_06690 [Planctomycetes bacterium RBG_13_44_8b]